MKHFILILSFVVLTTSTLLAQSELLSNQIKLDKNEFAFNGFTLLDSGGGSTNNKWALIFDHKNFEAPYLYYAVFYMEGCSSCDIRVYFDDKTNNVLQELEPVIQRSNGVVRATFYTRQEVKSAYGDLAGHAKSNSKVYTYSLLFRKKLD